MDVQTQKIKWGEPYEILVSATDTNGDPLSFDETYNLTVRFCKGQIGGEEIHTEDLAIAAGNASATIDTGTELWEPGCYYWDIRITQPDGDEYWTDPVLLVLRNRNAPKS